MYESHSAHSFQATSLLIFFARKPPQPSETTMSTPEPRVLRLPWTEFAARMSDRAIVLVPCGAVEQHGPHLPLGVDALLSEAVSLKVASALNALVMPALTYGYKSMPKTGGGPKFPGTTNLTGSTYQHVVMDVLRELRRHGAKRVVFLNGHLENQWFLTEGIDEEVRHWPDDGSKVVRIEYWSVLRPDLIADIFPQGLDIDFEHAAQLETSLMLHYHPELVRVDQIPDEPPFPFPPYDVFPADMTWGPKHGALTRARGASAEKGQRLTVAIEDGVIGAIRRAFNLGD